MFHKRPTIPTTNAIRRPNLWWWVPFVSTRTQNHNRRIGEYPVLLPVLGASKNQTWLLDKLPIPARCDALAAALAVCAPHETGPIAAELVELAATSRPAQADQALRHIARFFAKLGQTDRDVALRLRPNGWDRLADDLAGSSDPLSRASAAILGRATKDSSLVRRLGELIVDRDPAVAEAAEAAVLELIELSEDPTGLTDQSGLDEAMRRAAGVFSQHRRREVLLASLKRWGSAAGLARLRRLDAEATDDKWLTDVEHATQMGLRSAFRRERDPWMAAAALVWMKMEPVAAACRDRVLEAGSPEEYAAILRASHLMANPERGVVFTAMLRGHGRESSEAFTPPRAAAGMPLELRERSPSWIAALPMSTGNKVLALAELLGDAGERVRHAVVRASCSMPMREGAPETEGFAACIDDLCFDEDARVAGSAAISRLRQRPPVAVTSAGADEQLNGWKQMARSPHGCVRRLSVAVLERYASDDEDSPARVLSRLRVLRRDPNHVLNDLRARMGLTDPEESIAAMKSAVRLGLVEETEVELVRLLWSDESRAPGPTTTAAPSAGSHFAARRVAATAAAALGEGTTEGGEAALRASLLHPDPRVCSNAVESLARRARRRGDAKQSAVWLRDTICELRDQAPHRVRATAAWMLVLDASLGLHAARVEPWRVGVDAAGAMIRDHRREHALAGLWLAERIAALAGGAEHGDLHGSLARLVRSDDVEIRTRAVRCASRMIGRPLLALTPGAPGAPATPPTSARTKSLAEEIAA